MPPQFKSLPPLARFDWDFCFDHEGLQLDDTPYDLNGRLLSFSYLSVYEHYSKTTVEGLIRASYPHHQFSPKMVADLFEFAVRKLHIFLKRKREHVEREVDRNNIIGLAAVIFELERTTDLNVWRDFPEAAAKLPVAVEEACAFLKDFEESIECVVVREKLRTYQVKKKPEEIIMQNWADFYNNVKKKSFAFKLIDICMETLKGVAVEFFFPFETFQEAVECIYEASTAIDIRVSKNLLPLFREIFTRTEDFERAMDHMYTYFWQKELDFPAFKKFLPSFEDDLQRILAQRSLRRNFNKHCRVVAYFLTVAPKPAIRTILSQYIVECANNPNQAQGIIEVMHKMTPFFKCKVHIFNVFHAPTEWELLVATLFRRSLTIDWDRLQLDSPANRHAFVNFFVVLTRTTVVQERKRPSKLGARMKPVVVLKKCTPALISATELVRTITRLLHEKPVFNPASVAPRSPELPLRVLNRLLSLTETPQRIWMIKWKRQLEEEDDAADPVALGNELFELLRTLDSTRSELLNLVVEALGSLAKKLEADDWGDSFERLAIENLVEHPWGKVI